MTLATLTSKGQVTIPSDVRRILHLNAGDKLDFRVGEDKAVKMIPVTLKAKEVYGMLAAKGHKRLSVREMDRRIVARLREKHLR